YGQLSHRHLDDLCAGARVELNEDKQDPLDFVLWKAAKAGEPSWPSPWGNGRPGWHIECSAMATHFLGDTLDIHGGGYDLIFPHHENERAQSEGALHKKFVNIWMHTGFVEVHEEKMSKSLGNFFTIRDVLKDYDAQTIRYFLVSSHYRSPVNYSDDNLQQARTCCERLYLSLMDRKIQDIKLDENNPYVQRFYQAMDDDFNTPVAISVLCELSREINITREHHPDEADMLASILTKLASILGLLTEDPQTYLQHSKQATVSPDQIDNLVRARDEARANKDFARADEIRKHLTDLGIILEDSAQGTRWRV
ncbi:MAG: cysteine--tRNA ligase, partial [Gammaproteobacteria bacterium]